MVGSLYPFPLIEDGDFDIPSVYMTEEEGKRLAEYAGGPISLESRVEEKACLAQYGDVYRGYLSRVPCYLLFF